MKSEIRNYLVKKFQDNNSKINLRNLSDEEIFYYVILFKEGMEFPIELLKQFLKYAKEIIDIKNIKERINELKKGDINLDDFSCGREMAEYLENGII